MTTPARISTAPEVRAHGPCAMPGDNMDPDDEARRRMVGTSRRQPERTQDMTGITRKEIEPLLEQLDEAIQTRRDGNDAYQRWPLDLMLSCRAYLHRAVSGEQPDPMKEAAMVLMDNRAAACIAREAMANSSTIPIQGQDMAHHAWNAALRALAEQENPDE